jgi:acetyl-CoA C-acetyltransferase
MKKSDIDLWEINEAFAAQVLGCQRALNDQNYCKEQLSIDSTFGEIDNESLNVAGGAIAIGHPVAASGPRILLNIIHLLKNKKLKTGIVSICIGGGMGGAAHVKLC